jgi:hypothetical protein
MAELPQVIQQQLTDFASLFDKARAVDTSHGGEYRHLRGIVAYLGVSSGYVVDMAAYDGVTQSCTLGFFKDPGWSGLALEMDARAFAKLAFLYSHFPNARLARNRVTPRNVGATLRGFEVPDDFTLLNLDIDSFDLYVMDAILASGFRPRVISMEVNEKIPPPLFFTVEYDDRHVWQRDHFYGCSLAAAAQIVKPYGYILESLQYSNAIFVRADVGSALFRDVTAEAAYDAGYRNRPDRKRLYAYNADVDCLLDYSTAESIDFLNRFFEKYKGRYTLRAL